MPPHLPVESILEGLQHSARPTPRFRAEDFQRFEHVLQVYIRDGVSITLDPAPLAATTFVTRMRDAVRGFFMFHHPCALLSSSEVETLTKLWPDTMVRTMPDGLVVIENKNLVKRSAGKLAVPTPSALPTQTQEFICTLPPQDLQLSFLQLYEAGVFPSPLRVPEPSPEFLSLVETFYKDQGEPYVLSDTGVLFL